MNAVIAASGQSPPVSMNTCLVSEPQIPHSRVSITSQSGPIGCGSAMSRTPIGVARRCCSCGLASAGSGSATGSGSTPNTRAHAARSIGWRRAAAAGDLEVLRAATRRFLRTIDDLTDEQARDAVAAAGLEPGRGHHAPRAKRRRDARHGRGRGARRGASRSIRAAPSSARPASRPVATSRRRSCCPILRRACDLAHGVVGRAARRRGGIASASRPKKRHDARVPVARWREVEVHHVDLDMGYEPSDWPVGVRDGRARARSSRRVRGPRGAEPPAGRRRLPGRRRPITSERGASRCATTRSR